VFAHFILTESIRSRLSPHSRRIDTMAIERITGPSSLIDVLDRVLDKGIVIDPWVRSGVCAIDLTAVDTRLVVASVDAHAEIVTASPSTRSIDARTHQQLLAEIATLRAALERASRSPRTVRAPTATATRRRHVAAKS
jgi:hypothetical protein